MNHLITSNQLIIYRSQSQLTVEFDEFLSNFENLLNFVKELKPSFTIIMGNFNARSTTWWPDDITSPEGTDINSLTIMHGLHQLISDPTHLLLNWSSCIDLIFTDQPNLELIVVFILPCIRTVIIKLFIVNSI